MHLRRFVGVSASLTAAVLFACTSDNSTSPTTSIPDGGTPDGVATGVGTASQAYAFGPVGAAIGVTAGPNAVTATIPTASAAYSHVGFSLGALDAATSYTVAVTTPPSGQTCAVYAGASGTGATLSVNGTVRAGCEWTVDFLGRSSDDKVTAYSNNSTSVVIGGSARAIGASPPMGEGRYVAFRADQEGLAPGSPALRSIYWRDRMTGETRLVSHTPDGSAADADSFGPAISADGLHVVFYSSSTNLVANDTNKSNDIFLWSAADNSLKRVSVGPNGEEAKSASQDPSISGDGTVVAFITDALEIVPTPNDSNIADKVVRIDLAKGERTVVSRDKTSGNPADGALPMLSEDGNRVVFWSYRNVTGDINPDIWDVFVYDHATGKQWPVSQASTGANRNQGSDSTSGVVRPAISGDGKWVTYSTTATNVVPSVADSIVHAFLVEADHCDSTSCNVVHVDQANGTPADKEMQSDYAPLTFDGRWVSFTSDASNLGVANNGKTNAFLYDRTTKALTAITKANDGYGGTYTSAVPSEDGAYVVFGAYQKYDARFDTDGIFAQFTGQANAFSWQTGPVN